MNALLIFNETVNQIDLSAIHKHFQKIFNLKVVSAWHINDLPPKTDVLISFGGDGTVLKAVELLNGSNIPLLTINGGKVGALCEFQIKDLKNISEKILENIEAFPLLTAKIGVKNMFCFNEFSINRVLEMGKSIKIEVSINDTEVQKFSGDGITVATFKGSTGYSKVAGGKNISKNEVAITPLLSANGSSFKANLGDKVIVKTETVDSIVSADGRRFLRINPNDLIQITKSKYKINFVVNSYNA